ncbi:hypothetical protein F5Y11DRAFT_318798 [Daldinia sp. FL1419]|nr:hypothetical protein F5Y11DRAFT_318798 [Daldinia sp. FL1419]
MNAGNSAASASAPPTGATSTTDTTAVADNRPELSPYIGHQTILCSSEGFSCSIPTSLINKYFRPADIPKLPEYFKKIPSSCVHVIAHFIYTGTYQCLKPKGPSQYHRDLIEFATCTRVYWIARAYGIVGLLNLARGEMERFKSRLHVTQVLDTLKAIYPTVPSADTWLHGYFASLVGYLIDNPSIVIGYSPAPGTNNRITTVNYLVGVAIELSRRRVQAAQSRPPTVIVIQGHLHELQTRGSEHLIHKPISGGALKCEKGPEEEAQKQSNGGNTLPSGSASQPKESSEGSPDSSNNQPEASLVGVNALDFDIVFGVPMPGAWGSDELGPNAFSPAGGSGLRDVERPSLLTDSHGYMSNVPLTIGAATFFDTPDSRVGGNNLDPGIARMLTVCAEERFRNFSPEELRWKQMLWDRAHPN